MINILYVFHFNNKFAVFRPSVYSLASYDAILLQVSAFAEQFLAVSSNSSRLSTFYLARYKLQKEFHANIRIDVLGILPAI